MFRIFSKYSGQVRLFLESCNRGRAYNKYFLLFLPYRLIFPWNTCIFFTLQPLIHSTPFLSVWRRSQLRFQQKRRIPSLRNNIIPTKKGPAPLRTTSRTDLRYCTGLRMDSDRIRMKTNPDVTFYHILIWIRMQIQIFSNTNTKRIVRIRIQIWIPCRFET